MNIFDVLIIGGGASGLSCALVLGSAKKKNFAKNKLIGIISHQKSSDLQTAILNNVLGLPPETSGNKILQKGLDQLSTSYDHVIQIRKEKVVKIERIENGIRITTNKSVYYAKVIVIATGYSSSFFIDGLKQYIEPHQRSKPEKVRIQLKNTDHLVSEGIYVAGTLAGWRSQFAIACGSGASVATDILTKWNDGIPTHVHDKN
jgi:NADH dehydrogenase FAD-containing subunit